MKNTVPVLAIILTFAACNNSTDSDHSHSADAKTPADSLMELVMDGHNLAMPKMSKLSTAQKRVQEALDSINKLPGKFRESAAAHKTQLDSLMKDLRYAENGMNRWMEEFVMDSAENNQELRMKYLEEEKLKIDAVKENIFSSLKKADSLLKK